MSLFSRGDARTAGVWGGGLEARVVAIALMSTVAALFAAFSVYQYSNWSADRAQLAKDSAHLAQAIGAAAHKGLSTGDGEASLAASRLVDSSETAIAAAYSDLAGRRVQFGKAAGLGQRLSFKGVKSLQTRSWAHGLEVRAPHYVAGRQVGRWSSGSTTARCWPSG